MTKSIHTLLNLFFRKVWRSVIITLLFFSAIHANSQNTIPDCSAFKSDTAIQALKWFPEAKFGIFIHMTLQNVPMTEDESGYKNNIREARKISNKLDLSKYDAKQQAKLFKSWGAKYVVLTTKHHVGFALFDGPSDFNIMNSSQVKRDIVKEYVDAIRAEGMKVGLYYSLPDWCHPDYATLVNSKLPPEERKATRAYAVKDDTVRWNRFVEQMFREVEFLCTNYGKIDLLWFDGDWERSAEQWKSKELACMIYKHQPECVVNNRLRHIDLGHYATPENIVPLADRGGWWEFCMTPGDNWDGPDADTNIKSPAELIRITADVIGLNGNMLMNVAPIDKGAISSKQIKVMDEVGHWITEHAEAIYGTRGGFPFGLFNGPVTSKGNVLYLFIHDIPKDEIVLKGTQNNIKRITQLKNGKELAWRYSGGFKGWDNKGWLYIQVPADCVEKYTTVIKVEFADDEVTFNTPSGTPFSIKN